MTYDELLTAMFPEGQEITREHIESVLDQYEQENASGMHDLELERDSLREELRTLTVETEKIRLPRAVPAIIRIFFLYSWAMPSLMA